MPLAVTKNAALLLLLMSDWPTGLQGQQEMELKLNRDVLLNAFKPCKWV